MVMKNGLFLFVCLTVVFTVPAVTCADSGALGLPGLQSRFGGSLNSGNTVGCCGIGSPTVYFGLSVPESNGDSTSLDANNSGIRNLLAATGRVKNANRGFWLGTAIPVCLGHNVSILGTAWYLFPGASEANHQGTFSTPSGTVSLDWSSMVNHWFVDGAIVYGECHFSTLLGARYDYDSEERYSPDPDVSYNGNERADTTFKSFIPFIGFQSIYSNASQRLNFRILGAPVVLGTVTIGSTTNGSRSVYDNVSYSSGYFVEFFAEYSLKLSAASHAGLFGRWNLTRATSTGPYTNHAANGIITSDNYDLSRNQYTWTIGGSFTFNFGFPF